MHSDDYQHQLSGPPRPEDLDLFEVPRIIRKSPPLPSLMHLCSYASSHTEGSTCNLYQPDDLDVPARRPPAQGAA